MNNYPSNNFSTVFFLVVVFIGMGVLIYHTGEITIENGQLKEAANTLQTSIATLNTENAMLKEENTALKTENATLRTDNTTTTDENSQLKTVLENAVAENTSLKASDAGKFAELEKLHREISDLRLENLQLKTTGGSGGGSSQEDIDVLQSTLLPIDLESWMKVAVDILVVAILFIGYTMYTMVKDIQRKKVAVLNEMYNEQGLSRKSRYTHIIKSRFVDR